MDAYKGFMRLCNETTYFSGNLEEEGEDEMSPQDQGNQNGDGNMNNPPMGDMPGGNDMQQDPGMNNDGMGNQDAAFDPSQQPPVDANQSMDGASDMQGQEMGGDMPPMGSDELPMDDEIEEEDTEEDEVIDVDDITNAQEKTNARVNKVGRNLGKVDDKLVDVMNLIKSLKGMIDANNAEIEAFKSEFEKRNPTPTEKMNLRSLDSYPFNTNPTKYWQDKAEQSNVSGNRYEAYADNSVPTAKQEHEYVITQDDVEDYTDNSIQDSFHIDDDLRSTIEKIFDL